MCREACVLKDTSLSNAAPLAPHSENQLTWLVPEEDGVPSLLACASASIARGFPRLLTPSGVSTVLRKYPSYVLKTKL